MIATHAPKMFNARIKSSAIAAKIVGKVPPSMICSQTIKMRREMWAAPVSAAEMKIWREAVAKLPNDFSLEPQLPDIKDPQLKQLLIPTDWRNDQYISVSPVASMGVIHELYKRLYEQNLLFKKWVIQPTPAAMANHGEALLMQSGAVRMLCRGPAKIVQGNWRGDFVQLTARCEGMNISSGMVAAGFPAITAIGGFVHSLERKIGQDIEFAFGFKSADWVSGVPKLTLYKASDRSSSPTGRVKGACKVTPGPGYSTEEIVANCEIVLLLKTKADSAELKDILMNTHRISGGRLFNVEVSVISNGIPPKASYILDASADINRKRKNDGLDSLQAALEMYAMDGGWVDGEWYQLRNGYTLNQTGYAFLERPIERTGSRGNYPHAWAEPTFTLITQGSMSENCWWSKNSNDTGMFWKGN
ncbi:hypothetical protein [Hafnia paralvei]|uniref:hypothetical protein n=1 Tax=Hafnia paralvei TaxID=546367 RepID=UPI001419535C|nr:hypothetical protein [Hafnia paralvei]NIH33112.1 hypothetical protein [Hafnia paralvei]